METLPAGTLASDLEAIPWQMVVDSDGAPPMTHETFVEKARLVLSDFDEAVVVATSWCYLLNGSKYGGQLAAKISDWLQQIAIAKSELDIPAAPERSSWQTQLQQVERNADRVMAEYAESKDIMEYAEFKAHTMQVQ